MTSFRFALGAAAVALALTTLAGCGGDGDSDSGDTLEGLSGEEVREASIEDMLNVTSMHIKADILAAGEASTHLDLALDSDGRCTGTWAIGEAAAEIRSDGEYVYLLGDEAFWAATTGGEAGAAQTMEQLGEKWARLSAEETGDICSLDDLLGGLTTTKGASIELGDVVEHDGRKALEVVTTDAEGVQSNGLIAWEGEHHMLEVRRDGDEGGNFKLSAFGEPVDVTLPAEGEFVDIG